MKTRSLLLLGFLALAPRWAVATTSATSVTPTLYKVYFSASGLCTAPFQTIDYGSSGKAIDILGSNPEFGSGTIADGTYKCVIFKMSDTISFTPTATDGVCVGGQSVTRDMFRPQTGDGGSTVTPTSKNPEDGSTVTATSGNDTLYVYISRFSTTTTGSSSNAGTTPPTSDGDSTGGLKLSADVVVDGDETGTFVFDTRDKVDGTAFGTCDMNPPNFGFRLSS